MSIHPTNMACRGILHHLLLFLLLAGSAAPAVAQDRVTYYHTDHAGSPVAATDAGGEVVWRESYAPYGSRLMRQAPDNELWFTGKREDATLGLHYFGARWYDAELGRFISMDPAGFDENNVQLFNRYAYANNNPYRYVDPDGRAPVLALAVPPIIAKLQVIFGSATAAKAATAGTGSLIGVGGFILYNEGKEGHGNRADESPRGKSRNKPPEALTEAEGRPHSIIERPGRDGQYTTHYGDGTWKQYRGSGGGHGQLPRPNVKEAGKNIAPDGREFIDRGRVRPPRQAEIPRD